jgi:nucleotide-binding universal stress UspA family protein
MYGRVIVGTDGSQRALRAVPVGSRAAASFGCPLELVHVHATADPEGVDLTGAHVVVGEDPARDLVRLVSETDPPGLLCLSGRGRSALAEAVFGSVTAEVLRTLHAPMLITGPRIEEPRARWRRLLVCLDGSDTSASILPVATAWAQHLDLEVQLLHVGYPIGDPRIGEVDVPEEERAAARQVAAAAQDLEAAGITVHRVVDEHSHAAEGITERASREAIDLIALATHGRTGLQRLVAGSVALQVIRRASAPVLTVRPAQLR